MNKNMVTLRNLIQKEAAKEFKLKLENLLKDLKDATPVLTGKARDSWALDFSGKTTAIVSNSQDYIEILNQGSSQQAPRYFIERVLLDNGFKVKGRATTKK
jgi:hypothetical protein